MAKIYTVQKNRRGVNSNTEGTLTELIAYFRYTLECGQSWEHEKGNKKINRTPTSGKSLVTNLNNAVNNSAANGYAGVDFRLI